MNFRAILIFELPKAFVRLPAWTGPVTFEDLQRPAGTLDVLLYLFRHQKAPASEILSDTGIAKETFYRIVERLKSYAYVFEEEQVGFPTYVYFRLTKAGEAVAEPLAAAADRANEAAVSLDAELAELERAGDPSTVPRRLAILDLLVEADYSRGKWDAVLARGARLAELARAAGDGRREIQGLLAVGRILQKRGRHDEAVRQLSEALRLAEATGADDLASDAEYLLGADLERRSLWTEALARFASAGEHAGRARDAIRAAAPRQATARIAARQGRFEDSLAILQEVAADLERAGADEELPRVYVSLGSTSFSLDRPDAGRWYGKAVEVARRVVDVRMEASGLAGSAADAIRAKDFPRAERALARARRIFEDLGDALGLGTVALNTAQLYSEQNRWSDADIHFDEALRIARESANRFQEGWVLFSRGQMAKRRGRREEARALIVAAKRIFSQAGARGRVARCEEELRALTARRTRRRTRPATRRTRRR